MVKAASAPGTNPNPVASHASDHQAGAWPAGIAFRDAEESHPLDWPSIARHLAHHRLDLDLYVPPRQFAGGLANLNFLIRVNDSWMVLRRPPNGPLPAGANDMRREHRILSCLWRRLPLAPRSHHLCTDTDVCGAPFQILEFRAGVAVRGDCVSPFPTTTEVGQMLSRMLIETLATVHAVDPDAVGLGELGRPEGFFRRTAKGWIARAELATGGALSPAAHAIAHWLDRTPDPACGPATLLHNDFKLDNILLDPANFRPLAIVDWDMGTRGDALFDAATLLSYWTEPGDPPCMHRLAQMPTTRPGFFTREAAAAAYAAATGRSLADLKPYRVLAMFKLGAVFHQLHRRYLSGETRDARYTSFGALGDELFEFTLDVVNDKIF